MKFVLKSFQTLQTDAQEFIANQLLQAGSVEKINAQVVEEQIQRLKLSNMPSLEKAKILTGALIDSTVVVESTPLVASATDIPSAEPAEMPLTVVKDEVWNTLNKVVAIQPQLPPTASVVRTVMLTVKDVIGVDESGEPVIGLGTTNLLDDESKEELLKAHRDFAAKTDEKIKQDNKTRIPAGAAFNLWKTTTASSDAATPKPVAPGSSAPDKLPAAKPFRNR